MFGLALGLMIPHGPEITWTGYAYNVGLATLGNIVGGALFVGGLYWIGSPRAKDKPAVQPAHHGTRNGTVQAEPVLPNRWGRTVLLLSLPEEERRRCGLWGKFATCHLHPRTKWPVQSGVTMASCKLAPHQAAARRSNRRDVR